MNIIHFCQNEYVLFTNRMAKMLYLSPVAPVKMILLSVQNVIYQRRSEHHNGATWALKAVQCVVSTLAKMDEFRKAEPQLILWLINVLACVFTPAAIAQSITSHSEWITFTAIDLLSDSFTQIGSLRVSACRCLLDSVFEQKLVIVDLFAKQIVWRVWKGWIGMQIQSTLCK